MGNIKIAIMGTDYPRLSLPALLEKVKGFGVDYVELVLHRNIEKKDVSHAQELLERYGIAVSGIASFSSLNATNTTQEIRDCQNLIINSIEIAKELEAKFVITYFGSNTSRSKTEAISQYCMHIQPCLEAAKANDIIIALENEFSRDESDLTRTAKGCLEIIKKANSPNFKLNFDLGNFQVAGEEAFPYAYRILKKYIAYIHVKNVVKYEESLYGIEVKTKLQRDLSGDYICGPLSEGAINCEAFLTQLKKDNYSGFLSIEPHVLESKLDEVFLQNANYIKSKLRILL